MDLRALITKTGHEMSLADLRAQIEESGVAISDLIAWITDAGTLAITRDDGSVPGAIALDEIFDDAGGEYGDIPETDLILYIGTDDEGDDVLCFAPKGEFVHADLH
ncbi:MAG TPA: hypothetical protein VLB83_05790 [Candidatus Paceibacterota bacterium]|nr:hypothetical protein [Candidatus Paceibacterota bacterium]